MAKLEECRIYQSNDALPVGWEHPRVVLLAKKFTELGIALMVPLDRLTGAPDGDRFPMSQELLLLHYRLMPKREQDNLVGKETREKLAR